MEIVKGRGVSVCGAGVSIKLTGDELASAIRDYLVAHNVHINGASTVIVNSYKCINAEVYVDPSGFVIGHDGNKHEYNDIKR